MPISLGQVGLPRPESAWWMGSDENSYVEVSGSLACGRVSSTRLVGEAPASGDKVGLYKVGGHRDDAQKVWVLAVK